MNKVTLLATESYLLNGTGGRTQALLDSKGAVITEENGLEKYTVSGVKGLLQWVADLNNADGTINFSLDLTNDIVLPQYEITTKGTSEGKNLEYYYNYEVPIKYDENGMPINSNWIGVSAGSKVEGGKTVSYGLTGIVDGKSKVISGLRTNNSFGLVHTLEKESEVKNLTFEDAIVKSSGNAAVVVSLNKGTVTHCTVANSQVAGAGEVGAVVAKNEGTVSDCHNVSTDVIGGKAESRASELVGGVVGHNVGDKSIDENRTQGVVTNCTNSGKVISNGTCGNNFTGGIVGHSYGIVSYCINTGYVESSTDAKGNNKTTTDADGKTNVTVDVSNGYYTSVGGIVGNCSFGRVIACINEGKVKSGTENVGSTTTNNRVGGVIGYSGSNSYVVACGNVGDIEISGADNDHVGGIVGHLYHSYYNEVKGSVAGQVYGSWTKSVLTEGNSSIPGIGDLDDRDNDSNTDGVFETKVFDGVSSVTDDDIEKMNAVINSTSCENYYNKDLDSDTPKYCSKTWTWSNGSWPTLTTGTTSN